MTERRIPDQSLPSQALEVLGRALETTGSLSRNTLLKGAHLLGAEDRSIPYEDILKGRDFMEAHEFIDASMQMMGLEGYDTHGDNWAESTAKFGVELASDIATDPITYIPYGGQVYATGKIFGRVMQKLAPKALKEAMPWAVEGLVKHAEKSAVSTATGAAVGALTPVDEDSESPLFDRLRNTAAGAAIVFSGSPVANGILSSVKYASDQGIDLIYKGAHPKVVEMYKDFMSPSTAYKTARDAKKSLAGVTREVKRMNDHLLEEFGADDLEIAIRTFDAYVPDFVKMRNMAYKTQKVGKHDYDVKNAITKAMNGEIVRRMKADGVWTPAMDRLVQRNRAIIDIYNDVVGKNFGYKNHTPLTGIDIHTPEIFDKDALSGISGEGIAGFVKRATDEPVRTGGLSATERFAQEAESVIFSMMRKEERDAVRFMSDLNKPVNTLDARNAKSRQVLRKLDDVTNAMKGSMLTLSHSWLKNNFLENTLRTFVEHGFVPAGKAAGLQARTALSRIPKVGKFIENDLIKDIKRVTATENAMSEYIKYSDANGLAKVGVEYGTLNSGFFKETLADLTDKESQAVLIARLGTDELQEKIAKLESRGHIAKTVDGILDASKKVIGDTGSAIENAARINSLENFIKLNASKEQMALIKKHGYDVAKKFDPDLDRVYRKSNKMVDDAFFDYSDLSLGEEKILKRLFPFYSFYSKNAVYWGDMLSHRIANASKALKVPLTMVNYSPDMPLYEKMQLTEYERSIPHGKGPDGKTITAGNFSMTDYMESLGDPSGYLKGKVHPLLSGGATMAQILGKKIGALSEPPTDSLGRKLLISEDRNRRIRAPYYNEQKIALIDEMLGSPFGTTKTPDGRLRVAGDLIPTLATASNLFPVPIVDTVADVLAKGDLASKIAPVKKSDPDLRQRISTIRRNRQTSREPYKSFVKDNMAKHTVANYKNKKLDTVDVANQAKIYTDQSLSRQASQLHAQEMAQKSKGSMFINDAKPSKSAWNVMGLKVSPRLINQLAQIEGYIPTARVLGEGVHKEGAYSIGHSIYGVYPMSYGMHKKGERIKAGDIMDRKEAALQMAAHIGSNEKRLDRVLKNNRVKVTQGIYDALIHSMYNTGHGWLKNFKGNIAEYFMRLPATVNNVPHKALMERRAKEYYMAKKESDMVLGHTVKYIKSLDISASKKASAIKKAYKMYYFPQKYQPLRKNETFQIPYHSATL